jgi:hypothetical protein
VTKFLNAESYLLAEEYLPKSKLPRSFTPESVMRRAADAGGTLAAAREARRQERQAYGIEDGDMVNYGVGGPRSDLGQQARSTTSTTHGLIDSLLGPQPKPLADDQMTVRHRGSGLESRVTRSQWDTDMTNRDEFDIVPEPSRPVAAAASGRQNLPDRGTAPVARQTLPDRGASAPQTVKYDLVDEILSNRAVRAPKPADDGGLESWARQEARRLGIDEDVAVRVGNTEGGFKDPVRQNMEGAPAYGPYQMYIGGPSNPGLGDELLQRGIDPRKPENARAAITFALEHAKKNGWQAFQGAAANNIGNWDGINRGATPSAPGAATQQPTTRPPMRGSPEMDFSLIDQILSARGAPSTQPSAATQAAQQGVTAAQQTKAARQGTSVWELGKLTPNQYHQGLAEGLDTETALAVCGPAAAIAFARTQGRNPTLREATELAKTVGWTVEHGMAGPASQQKLLEKMGIESVLEEGKPDVNKVIAAVSSGTPVILSSPGHYYVAEQYDPKSRRFNLGESAKVLKASGGNSWYTLDEIANLGMGSIRAALYMGGN